MSAIDKTPKFISRVSRISVSMSATDNGDIHRHFNVSDISRDLRRNPHASSALQVHLCRFVYVEHIVPNPGFALRLQVWAWSPAI
jgi:hypothetical protein